MVQHQVPSRVQSNQGKASQAKYLVEGGGTAPGAAEAANAGDDMVAVPEVKSSRVQSSRVKSSVGDDMVAVESSQFSSIQLKSVQLN